MIAIVLLLLGTAFVAADPLGQICGDINGNYTANSTYSSNLLLLSAVLASNASSTPPLLFAKSYIGFVPDIVYGLTLCRGDANASACRACIANAFLDAQRLCGPTKNVTIFYDPCLLRFSSRYFLDEESSSKIDTALVMLNKRNIMEPVFPGWDPSNAESVAATNKVVTVLLQETAKKAAYSSRRRYATGRMDGSGAFPPLYSLAQCTPDLLPGDCWECLQNITELMTRYFAGRQGGQILRLRCNLRYQTYSFYSGRDSIIVLPSTTAVVPPAPSVMPSQQHKRRMTKVLVISFTVSLLGLFLCLIASFGLIRKHKKGKVPLLKVKMNVKEEEEAQFRGLEGRSSEFTFYDFSRVLEATGNFSEENKLGQGGFGPVYKGHFADNLEIAVKRLDSHSGQGLTEFENEVHLIAKLQHTNLVRLFGCCTQGDEKILIYEYLPNKSLDFFIFGTVSRIIITTNFVLMLEKCSFLLMYKLFADETRRDLLDWSKRLVIIEGIAQGLLYLHKHSRLRVIHRDLKASNILLDREMNPKISDFGLAKIFSTTDKEGNTKRIVGTYGYMAPEYASEGLFSIKSDVFSFGVLILEILSGKKTSSFQGYGDFINLLGHAWQLWKDGRWLQLVDKSLVTGYHMMEMMRCTNIALLCVQESAVDRPTMSDVVAMLSTESMSLPEPKYPAYFHIRVGQEEASTIVETCSLNDVTLSGLAGR